MKSENKQNATKDDDPPRKIFLEYSMGVDDVEKNKNKYRSSLVCTTANNDNPTVIQEKC